MERFRTSTVVIFTTFLALLGLLVVKQIFQLEVPVEMFEPQADTGPVASSSRNASADRTYLQIANRNLRMRVSQLERQVEQLQQLNDELRRKYEKLQEQRSDQAEAAPRSRSEPSSEHNNFDEEMFEMLLSLQDEVERLRQQNDRLKQRLAQAPSEGSTESTDSQEGQNDEVTALEAELEALAEENDAFRAAVGTVLGQMGEAAVPALTALLGHEQASVREWAAYVLAGMGAAASSAVSALEAHLSDPDPAVRQAVQQALNAIENAE